ncbi:hypothetical protein SBA7_500005 [Candidatus Sulfotelmatobacter sp. SbA7]|nr:hypothetical protein SBA7_500005 [Candidatus Sulfotelmatobacter sp. SbA7]
MSHTARNYYVNQSLDRSWLELSSARVEPRPFSVFEASRPSSRTHSLLHQLKRKLLRAALAEMPETGSFKQLCGAANQAADLAGATSHPLLVFPHLFDEMVTAVRERFQPDQIIPQARDHSSLATLDADLRFEGIHSVARGSDPISTGRCLWSPYQNATRGNRAAGQRARLPHIE